METLLQILAIFNTIVLTLAAVSIFEISGYVKSIYKEIRVEKGAKKDETADWSPEKMGEELGIIDSKEDRERKKLMLEQKTGSKKEPDISILQRLKDSPNSAGSPIPYNDPKNRICK